MNTPKRLVFAAAACLCPLLAAPQFVPANAGSEVDLAHQIFETMLKVPAVQPGHRPVHAKGLVCQGTFTASAEAANLSKAVHFRAGSTVPVTVRFSDGSPDPNAADNSPDAGPRGMAIRFQLPGGVDPTDIVAMSHNGFVVGSGEEFLALQKAIVATDPAKPHPWPIEEFLGAHPRAMKFVQENRVAPASFATECFFSNNAFVFINKDGRRQAARYQILPEAGSRHLSQADAKGRPPEFLMNDLRQRLTGEPVRYRLVAQLPNAGDATNDASLVWPDDRKTIELGVLSVNAVLPDSPSAQRHLAFDPANLTDGVEFSDDPLPSIRSQVYALSARHRHAR